MSVRRASREELERRLPALRQELRLIKTRLEPGRIHAIWDACWVGATKPRAGRVYYLKFATVQALRRRLCHQRNPLTGDEDRPSAMTEGDRARADCGVVRRMNDNEYALCVMVRETWLGFFIFRCE